jgi:flavin reductase (DIM6/NTAB) family NADH-FMN oxidoreductase RutF
MDWTPHRPFAWRWPRYEDRFSGDEVQKKTIGPGMFIYPSPAILLGANVNGKPNYSVMANCGGISLEPPTLYVSSVETHYTNGGIRENGTFSINIASTGQVVETDYCGIVSGKDTDKSQVFTSFYGELETAPMAEECPVNLECRLLETVRIHGMEVFIGQIVQAWCSEDRLDGDIPDVKKVDPIVYAGGIYWSVGDLVSRPKEAGGQYKGNSVIG